MSTASSLIKPGLLVELHGLSSASLNGKRGFALAWDGSKERWGVQLLDDTRSENLLNVRPGNLQPVPPALTADADKAQAVAREVVPLLAKARAASGKAARNRVVADAVEILGTAEAHDPSCAMVHQLRGDLAHITGDMPRMVVHMRRALTNSGGSSAEVALRRLGLAVALGETGDVAGEEAECRAVLASHPGHIQARFSLGQCLSRGGQPDDAIPELMMALQLPNDDPPLHERNVRNVREAALSQICESLRERAKRQQRKADHQGAAATLERLLSVPGTDAEVRAGTQANLAVSRARLGQLAEALLAAGRGVEAASHEGCVGHPDAGVPTKVTAFAVHTLAGVREAMGDAVATTGRDPGTDAAALYLQSKGLYAQAHQICKDPATRSAHGRVQAKAHPDIEWISDESMDTGVGIHCGGTARCVGAQGASLEGLPE